MDQTNTLQLFPAAARHAPHKPPTSACEELAGKPNHHVSRFHAIAASNAQMSTSDVAIFGSTRPDAIVAATAVPVQAPTKFVTAASITAWRGLSTLVATTVAME